MNEFIAQISDLGFTIVHDNILPLEEIVHGPAAYTASCIRFSPATLTGSCETNSARTLTSGWRCRQTARRHGSRSSPHRIGRATRRTFHLQLQSSLIFVSDEFRKLQIAGLGYCQTYRNIMKSKQPRWQDPGMNPAFMPPEFFRSKSANAKERLRTFIPLVCSFTIWLQENSPLKAQPSTITNFNTSGSSLPSAAYRSSVRTVWEPIILGCLEKEPDNTME